MIKQGYLVNHYKAKSGLKLLPVLIIWSLALVGAIIFFIATDDQISPLKDFYLAPWLFLVAATISAPLFYLWHKNEFNLAHPIIFAACSYFFPAFVIGGLMYATGLSYPFYIAYIDEPEYNVPLTLVIVSVGFAGLSVGFFLPLGRKIGAKIASWLPSVKWEASDVALPGLFLLVLGLINTVIAFVLGIIGFQRVEETQVYNGLLFLVTLLWLEAAFLLWLAIFKSKKLSAKFVLIITVLILTSISKALFAGNRGSLLQIFILILMAYVLSGRVIKFKQAAAIGVLLVPVLIIGMIYGQTFRNIKGSEQQVSVERYAENVFQTFDAMGKSNTASLEKGFENLAERLDAVSPLAVVVSNYEKLLPFEVGYGLDNNIWKDSISFFIPRLIWNDKPVASEPRKYSELYFNYGENSFTITPMGDLLRNFGFWGVPVGMLILGIILRIIYASLIEGQTFSFWRATLYFMLLTSVSYESFYGGIIPYLTKVGVISVFGLAIIWFLTRDSGKAGKIYGR